MTRQLEASAYTRHALHVLSTTSPGARHTTLRFALVGLRQRDGTDAQYVELMQAAQVPDGLDVLAQVDPQAAMRLHERKDEVSTALDTDPSTCEPCPRCMHDLPAAVGVVTCADCGTAWHRDTPDSEWAEAEAPE